jgi:hypothetical protein
MDECERSADRRLPGLRFFIKFALSNPRANGQSLTRSGAWVAPHSYGNTRSRWTMAKQRKSAPLEQAHRDEKDGKKQAIPQRGTTHRESTAPPAG